MLDEEPGMGKTGVRQDREDKAEEVNLMGSCIIIFYFQCNLHKCLQACS